MLLLSFISVPIYIFLGVRGVVPCFYAVLGVLSRIAIIMLRKRGLLLYLNRPRYHVVVSVLWFLLGIQMIWPAVFNCGISWPYTLTVLLAKRDSEVLFCLQSYQGLVIDRSLVY